MITKLKHWFLKPGNEYCRSASCLLCMVFTIIAIWWIYEMPCETWTDIAVDAVLIMLVIAAQVAIWTLLEYIMKHDSVG